MGIKDVRAGPIGASSSDEAELSGSSVNGEMSEMVELLKHLGVHNFAASVLVALSVHGPSDSRRLQTLCQLRQPEVSVAISRLRKHGVIIVDKIAKGVRGRPRHIYSIDSGIDDATRPFKEAATTRLNNLQQQLGRLNELSEHIRAYAN